MLNTLNTITLSFLNELMAQENSVKNGYINGKWFPHKSLEGGTDTIAYGHKLTSFEEESGHYLQGITDIEAVNLFISDLKRKLLSLESLWNRHFETPFDHLDDKYKFILLDLVFNVGVNGVSDRVRWKWPKLAQAIIDGRDQDVFYESIRHYTSSAGRTVALTDRSISICRSVGLDFKPVRT